MRKCRHAFMYTKPLIISALYNTSKGVRSCSRSTLGLAHTLASRVQASNLVRESSSSRGDLRYVKYGFVTAQSKGLLNLLATGGAW